MRYPEFLKKGDTIGFAAPSFGASTEPYITTFNTALGKFRQAGYQLLIGPNVYRDDGIGISSTPENCGREFTDLWTNEDCRAILSAGGGELMCEILDYIDFDAVREARPKWFMGFSDNTNISFLLPTLCDTASLYGPCAGAFGMEPRDKSIKDAFRLLTGKTAVSHGYTKWEKESFKTPDNPLVPYNLTEKTRLKKHNWDGSPVEGRFIGGCMDCLINLCGTCYEQVNEFCDRYADEGIIWFLESCDLNVFQIRRAVWQLDHAGWFRNARAFVIGRPLVYGQEYLGLDQYQAVLYTLGKYNVPVIMDADIGHLSPMMTMVNGGYGVLSEYGKNIQIEWNFQ